jgi:hypothetical protein
MANWTDLDIQAKTNHFLAHFRFVFAFDDLKVFVKQANMQPDSFVMYFDADTHALFASICYLYHTLLYSLHSTPAFAKVAPTLVFSFAKLVIPAGSRYLESSSFPLEFVYIFPVLLSCGVASKRPAFSIVHEIGLIHVVDGGSRAMLMKIDQDRLTGINQGDRLFFYDENMEPRLHALSSFLHSVAAFKTFSTFVPAPVATLPDQFSAGPTPAFRRQHVSFSFMSSHCQRWRLALPPRTSTFSWMRSGIGCFTSSARLSN